MRACRVAARKWEHKSNKPAGRKKGLFVEELRQDIHKRRLCVGTVIFTRHYSYHDSSLPQISGAGRALMAA
jgi:hypothetical protein